MSLDPDLLAILVCPETRRPLRAMAAGDLAGVNERLARGELVNRAGKVVKGPLSEALAREGDDLFYPVDDGIPVLLVDEGIPLT